MMQYEDRLSKLIGAITRVLFYTPRNKFRIAAIDAQIMPAVRLLQADIFCNEYGVPVAYAIWAFVSDEVVAELQAGSERILHLSEWNDGLNLWLMDIAAPFGHAFPFLRKLRKEKLSAFNNIKALKNKKNGNGTRLVNLNIRPIKDCK